MSSHSTIVDELVRSLSGNPEIESAKDEAEAIARASAARGTGEAWMREVASRRAAGAPLGLLLGKQRFMGVELITSAGALVPRAETELLGRTAVELLRARSSDGGGLRVADVCCGSGNLACGIAHALPKLTVFATDLTEPCVELARRNVRELGLEARAQVMQGDLLAGLAAAGLTAALDAIVANPPYISSSRLTKDRARLLEHEPVEAFDGGPYGLSIHQRLVREAPALLRGGGMLLMEIGLGQERQIDLLFRRVREWEASEHVRNERGEVRVVMARLRSE